jgi:hypothetical protein
MIPKQKTAGLRPVASLTITPRHGRERLPSFSPAAPRGGWTPEAVFNAAVAYAESPAHRAGPGSERLLAKCAYVALMAALPKVKGDEISERLNGIVRLGER